MMRWLIILWASLLAMGAVLLFHVATTATGDSLIGFIFTGTMGIVLTSALHRPTRPPQHF